MSLLMRGIAQLCSLRISATTLRAVRSMSSGLSPVM